MTTQPFEDLPGETAAALARQLAEMRTAAADDGDDDDFDSLTYTAGRDGTPTIIAVTNHIDISDQLDD